jgi:hypothetical protein
MIFPLSFGEIFSIFLCRAPFHVLTADPSHLIGSLIHSAIFACGDHGAALFSVAHLRQSPVHDKFLGRVTSV